GKGGGGGGARSAQGPGGPVAVGGGGPRRVWGGAPAVADTTARGNGNERGHSLSSTSVSQRWAGGLDDTSERSASRMRTPGPPLMASPVAVLETARPRRRPSPRSGATRRSSASSSSWNVLSLSSRCRQSTPQHS